MMYINHQYGLGERRGQTTGLVTDTSISHATPASFAAKQAGRDDEIEIAEDMITGVSRGKVDVLLGGGGRYLIPSPCSFPRSLDAMISTRRSTAQASDRMTGT